MNNKIPLILPLTHYDRLLKTHPQMWEFIQKDINYLLENSVILPIASVDDFSDKNLFTYVEFFVHTTIQTIATSSDLPLEEISSLAKQMPQMALLVQGVTLDYHSILNFELFGRKTFFFHNNLSDHLLETELSVDSELLKLPFDSCLFVYSAPKVVETAFSFMKVQAVSADLLYPISVYVTALPDKNSGGDKKLIMTVSHWRGDKYNFGIKREVAIRSGWKIEKSLKTDWEKLGDTDGEGLYVTASGEYRTTTDEEFYTDGLALFRLVLNSILYLSSNDPDIIRRVSGREMAINRANSIKSRLKSKKARQLAKKESILNFTSLGENTHPIYVTKHNSQDSSTNQHYNFKEYGVRFIVRGHWRNQPVGHNKMEKKLIWIKPYYKGSDMAELINRPYVVK